VRRAHAGALLVVLAVAAGAGAGACGRGGSERTTATTTTLRIPDRIELSVFEQLVVDRVPTGFSVQPDDVGDTGPSDLAKAVRDQGGTSQDREFLVRNGFVRGYQRLWADADDNELIVFLYEFEDASGARAQADAVASELQTTSDVALTRFQPEGIPGAVGLESVDPDLPGVIVIFTKSGYWGMVRLLRPETDLARAQAVTVARDQYERLP
jgi:hypothetical protein